MEKCSWCQSEVELFQHDKWFLCRYCKAVVSQHGTNDLTMAIMFNALEKALKKRNDE